MSPDGSGNPFSFLLPSSTSGNKKEKDCSGQRDQESLWNVKYLLLKINRNVLLLLVKFW